MTTTETARHNLAGLLPDHVRTLAVTDAEPVGLLDNRALGDALAESRKDTPHAATGGGHRLPGGQPGEQESHALNHRRGTLCTFAAAALPLLGEDGEGDR